MIAALTSGSTRVPRRPRARVDVPSHHHVAGLLAALSFVLSFFDLLGPGPLEIVVTAVVLVLACAGTDLAAQSVLRKPHRLESSFITAAILLFVLRPTIEPMGSSVSCSRRSRHPCRSTSSSGGGVTSSTPLPWARLS